MSTSISTVSPILMDHAVIGPPQGQWTVADWERLPADGNRYEIITGVLYMTTSPDNFHQWIISRFVRYVGIPLEDQEMGYWFVGPAGVILSDVDAVQPDFLVVLQEHAGIIQKHTMGAPDLVVEVLSPGNSTIEMQNKQNAYARAGVPEYVVVDPQTRTLHHYRLAQPGTYHTAQLFYEGDQVRFDCMPSITLHVGRLFADAPGMEP